jgi:hypothetical protein
MATAQRKQQRRDRWYSRRTRYREERKYRYQNAERPNRQKGGGGEPEESDESLAESSDAEREEPLVEI